MIIPSSMIKGVTLLVILSLKGDFFVFFLSIHRFRTKTQRLTLVSAEYRTRIR